MKLIGVIGESPYDTEPLISVWNNEFNGTMKFEVVLRRINGANLDSLGKMSNLLKAELMSKSYLDGLIFVRDLDGFRSEKEKQSKIKNWYSKLESQSGKICFLLLNIQEIESLHFADLSVFNKYFKTNLKSSGNPEMLQNPKEKLVRATSKAKRKFHVSDNKILLPQLDFKNVESKCQFYREFIVVLRKHFNL